MNLKINTKINFNKISKSQLIHLFILFGLFTIINNNVYSMDKKTAIETNDKIIEEGKMLYNTEITSWYASEIFQENYKGDKNKVGGYFSYFSKDKNQFINVFYNNESTPKVIHTIRFQNESQVSTPNSKNTNNENKESVSKDNVKKESVVREMTDFENELYIMRKKTLELMPKDTLFKNYDNTNINVIPFVYNGEKKVYLITVPKIPNIVTLGNDYEIKFDKNNNITSKKRLHTDILAVDYGNDKNRGITYHTHLKSTGDFFSVTDIANLLFFGRSAGWLQHYLVSENWVTMWDISNEKFTIKTKKEFDQENGK